MDTFIRKIFNIQTEKEFNEACLMVFDYQCNNCAIYKQFTDALKINPKNIKHYTDIPFLPISFFKTQAVYSYTEIPQITFTSSATTGQIPSKHLVANVALYKKSFTECFKLFYGNIEEYCVLALLPSYLERKGSSLVYMVQDLIVSSKDPDSGFYLYNYSELEKILIKKDKQKKVLLIGVTFSLLDFVAARKLSLQNTIVMETGGMKGRREELTRQQVHEILREGFGIGNIHSEYGMTELLSQAYSKANGIFQTPPWMRVLVRQPSDPFNYYPNGKQGALNIVDLANLYSCSFIATDDIGRVTPMGFEVLGRLDTAEIRGCNLMTSE